jgi:hypothetical protein
MSDMIDRAALLAEVDAMIAAAEGVAEIETLNGLNLGAGLVTATTRDVRAVIAALPPAQPDAPSNLQKVHIAPDAPAWKGNDAFCASLRNVPENAFKHAPAPDAVEALVKAAEAWEAFKAASTRVDHWVAVEQLDAVFATAIRAGGKP